MRLRVVMVACAALALSVGAATAAAGGGGDAKKKCKNGGWATFFRADATTFRNQTACVSYVQHGGKLYTTVADISFNVVVTPGSAAVTVSNSGPSDATVSAVVTYQGSCASGTISVASGTPVPAGGSANLNIVNGTGCTLNFYGQVTASDAADPDSKPNNYKNGFIGPPHEDDEAVWSLTP